MEPESNSPLSRSLAAGEFIIAEDMTNPGFMYDPLQVGINPSLIIALGLGAVTIPWEGAAKGYELRQAGSLAPPVAWAMVPDPAVLVGGRNTVTLPLGATPKIFRLEY